MARNKKKTVKDKHKYKEVRKEAKKRWKLKKKLAKQITITDQVIAVTKTKNSDEVIKTEEEVYQEQHKEMEVGEERPECEVEVNENQQERWKLKKCLTKQQTKCL